MCSTVHVLTIAQTTLQKHNVACHFGAPSKPSIVSQLTGQLAPEPMEPRPISVLPSPAASVPYLIPAQPSGAFPSTTLPAIDIHPRAVLCSDSSGPQFSIPRTSLPPTADPLPSMMRAQPSMTGPASNCSGSPAGPPARLCDSSPSNRAVPTQS